ncbi:hypothetical protein OESDEN_23159, partial [Oesophagostomum dentatum]
MVLGGDFRQVLPIIERGRDCDMVDACMKNSHLWRSFRVHHLSLKMRARQSGPLWCDFLMSVGNGEAEQDDSGRVKLPSEMISGGDLIGEVFGEQLCHPDSLSERAILAPHNVDAYRINEEALN